jgi:hypothetical protein
MGRQLRADCLCSKGARSSHRLPSINLPILSSSLPLLFQLSKMSDVPDIIRHVNVYRWPRPESTSPPLKGRKQKDFHAQASRVFSGLFYFAGSSSRASKTFPPFASSLLCRANVIAVFVRPSSPINQLRLGFLSPSPTPDPAARPSPHGTFIGP